MKKSVYLSFIVFFLLVTFLFTVKDSDALVQDSDRDGVPDCGQSGFGLSCDRCPYTKTTIVDQFGCSCSQKSCSSDDNPCTDDCGPNSQGRATCGFTNNKAACSGGYCSNGNCVKGLSIGGAAKLGVVFVPKGLSLNEEGLEVIKASGFQRIGKFSLDAALFDKAAGLGLKIDPIYMTSRSTIDWLKTNVDPFPNRRQALGYFMMYDEPNPDTCPQDSACYHDIMDTVAYSRQQLPWLKTSIILSAFPAFHPSDRWQLYAEPYYRLVDAASTDFYAWCWEPGHYSIYDTLIRNTIQYSNKPVIFYSEGGYIGPWPEGSSCAHALPVTSDWLVSAFQTSSDAGAEIVNWFWAPDNVELGDAQWCEMAKAADQITNPPNDVNADGVVNERDLELAERACNNALAGRIRAAIGSIGICGDGNIEGSEECDGIDLKGKTCVSLGYSSGALKCDDKCKLDASSCTATDNCINQPSSLSIVSDTNTFSDGKPSVAALVHPAWSANIPGATWIWKEYKAQTQTVTFTKTFDIPANAQSIRGTITIAADDFYTCYLNSEVPFTTSNPEQIIPGFANFIDANKGVFNVDTYLKAGQNLLKCVGRNGGTPDPDLNPAGLLYRLDVNWNCGINICGDGDVNPLNEECDDGNKINGDGCSSDCKKEIQTCTDTDGGNAPDVRGTVTDKFGINHLDYCFDENYLVEYSCSGYIFIESPQNCGEGKECKEGACVKKITTPCKDADISIVSDAATLADGNPSVATYVHPEWSANIPGATWIWKEALVSNPTVTMTVMFTRTFDLPDNAKEFKGTFVIAADDLFTCYLNSETPFTQVISAAGVGYYLEQNKKTVVIDNYLKPGTNILKCEVTNIGGDATGPWQATAQNNPAGLLYKLTASSKCEQLCGNGNIDSGEECDGIKFTDNDNCASHGFTGGNLRCISCQVNTGLCTSTSGNKAQFISQSVPSKMEPGKQYSVSVTMKNTGTTEWKKSENYKLGSQNPQDNMIWGIGRVDLPESERVSPNREHTFTFTVTAPPTEGHYNFQWESVQEQREWFGESTENVNVVTEPLKRCGDSIIQKPNDAGVNEECDKTELDGKTCTSFTQFTGGQLSCRDDCTFDYSGCTAAQPLSIGILLPPSNPQSSCNAAGDRATLAWEPINDAASYLVRVDEISNNNANAQDGWYVGGSTDIMTEVSGTSFISTIVPNKNYRWWVHSKNGNAIGSPFIVHFKCPGTNNPTVFYVSPDGDDRNPGTEREPYKTLEKAKEAVRGVNQQMTKEIIVYLRGGTYYLERTFSLDPMDSGTNGFNVVYKNYPGEIPVISGGKPITEWIQDGNKWKANVGKNIQPRQLYVNGKRAIRARSSAGLPDGQKTSTGFTTTDLSMQNWQSIRDVEFVSNSGWKQFRCGIQSISGNSITMKQPCWDNSQSHTNGPKMDSPTWIENAYELLDQPGEWYLNRETGWLYYMPRQGEEKSTAKVIMPLTETLVEGSGTAGNPIQNIQFEGITFSHAGWIRPNDNNGFAEVQSNFHLIGDAPIYESDRPLYPTIGRWTKVPASVAFKAAKSITFERNVFTHLGGAGLGFEQGSQENVISGNDFNDISGTGLTLGDTSNYKTTDIKLMNINNQITNNYIHDVSVEYNGGPGIWLGFLQNSYVAHNELKDLPYTGMSIGFMWYNEDTVAKNNLIEYNRIGNTVQLMEDGGAIYSLGKQPNNIIRSNLIHDSQQKDCIACLGKYGIGIYLDQGSHGITIKDNLIYRTDMGLSMHRTFDNLVENNIFSDADEFQTGYGGFGRDYATGQLPSGNKIFRNIFHYSDPDAILFNIGGENPSLSESDYNIYFHKGRENDLRIIGFSGVETLDQWKNVPGFDRNSLVIDPLFNDYERDDYGLKADSPAIRLGFRPLVNLNKAGIEPQYQNILVAQDGLCGNNQIDHGEECDGTKLNDQSCQKKGFASGTLKCYAAGTANQCKFDTSACFSGISDVKDIKSVTFYDFPIDLGSNPKFVQDLQIALPAIKDVGFNTVWLIPPWKTFNQKPLASPPEYSDSAFADLKQTLSLLRANHMKVILGLNYLGEGWAPEGIDACNWIKNEMMYNSFETYVKTFLTEISDYSDMTYILFFTENADPCGMKDQAHAKEVASLLRATLGSLPSRLPAELRSKFKIGYHDYSLINLNWANGESPILSPIEFDFVSMTAYGLEGMTDEQIRNEVDARASRFKNLYPSTPLIIGELGATSCNGQEQNQARVDGVIVKHALDKGYGFNVWGWKPVGINECANPSDGLSITNLDGTPRIAVGELRKVILGIIQPKCSDGTLYSQCSTNKPSYCSNGNLINKASQCGCPSGMIVTGETCTAPIDTNFQLTLGEEEYVMGPKGNFEGLDNSFFTMPIASGVRAFTAHEKTLSFVGSSLNDIKYEGIVLDKGNDFDNCGSWLNSAYKLSETHWIGWYHAEGGCPGPAIKQSMAFAESFDSGKTWSKPDYPNNQVLTADSATNGNDEADDAGDAKVMPIGDYFYLFFMTKPNWKMNIARSKISDEGRPGTWKKYYSGQYNEDALGGKSTAVKDAGQFVVFNSYLKRFIAPLVTGQWGFHLYETKGTDITSWEHIFQTFYPQVSNGNDQRVDSWLPFFDGRENKKQVYAYPSFIAPDGNSDSVGKEFYVYYMKIFDKDSFLQKYLMRRKITLEKTDSFSSKVELTKYTNPAAKKTKVSTEIAKPSEGYQKSGMLGYLLTYPKDGYQPLYECYIPIWNDYMVSLADPSKKNWEHCESDGDIFIRNIGWSSKTQSQETNTPLYRCFDQAKSDHFVSNDANCEGKTSEGLIGYSMNGPGIPAPCTLKSASWEKTTANEGEDVKLIVEGENCNGKNVNFVVEENDIVRNDPVRTNPQPATFSNNRAESTWTAEWQDDGILGGNPEYYFVATASGVQLRSQNELVVSQPAQLPSKPANLQSACSNDGSRITVSWDFVSGADKYALRIDDMSNNDPIRYPNIVDAWYVSGTNDLMVEIPVTQPQQPRISYSYGISPNTDYRFWIHSLNSAGISDTDILPFRCNAEQPARCGDGAPNQVSEECDDGNNINGDGCSANCMKEDGISLKYFGFYYTNVCWGDDPFDEEKKHDYTDEVSSFANIGHMDPWGCDGDSSIVREVNGMYSQGVKPIIDVGLLFYYNDQGGIGLGGRPKFKLYPDYTDRWNAFLDANKDIDWSMAGAFYLLDEGYWNGLAYQDIKMVADLLKNTEKTKNVPIFIDEAFPIIQQGKFQVPPSVDWISFNYYGILDVSSDEFYLGLLEALKNARSRPGQKVVLIMDSQWDANIHGKNGIREDQMSSVADNYYKLAESDDSIVGMIGFIYPGIKVTPAWKGARDLPKNVKDEYRRIGLEITKKGGTCGDGRIQRPNSQGAAEECDDGNQLSNDLCTNDCKVNNAAFNAVLTHPAFWPRDGQEYTGKRYLGTMGNAAAYGSQFMKVWSGPLNVPGESGNRQVVYQKYFGWDDQPNTIYEWESWQRDAGNILRGFKYGGDVLSVTPPLWPLSWMNTNYRPEFTRRSAEHYSCDSGAPVYGFAWSNLNAGQNNALTKLSTNKDTCYPRNDGNSDYVSVNLVEDFGEANSNIRKEKCYRDIPPIWGTDSNAYNICLDAPNAGRFEQRYAYHVKYENSDWNWHYGCEPLVYVWDYPENGPTNKFFRNGELKWAEFGQFERSKAYHNANENDFWSNGCKAVWDNQARKGGWIYSGVYQVGQNFYNDKGTDSSAPLITKPSPEPEPIAKTDIWLEALGFKGEAWCSVGKTCNTGWVTGPSVKVECPADKKLVNRGTLYSKWDGLKRFEGKTDCEGATGEASPRDGTDAFKTDQTSLWTREGTLLKNFGNMYNPRIIIDEGSEFKYKMWFFGWAKEDCNENVLHGNGCDAIFHARSKDSKNWEIYSGKDSNNNPIFDSTMNPSLWIPVISAQDKYYDQWHNGDPSVIKVGNNYYMAYSATGFDLDGIGYERQGDKDGDFYDIMGAVSANGIDWTKTSKPLLVYEKEAGAVDDINHGVAIMNGMYHRPSLMYEDGKFRLWFDYWNDRVDMGYAEMQAASTSDAFLTGTWNIINAGSNPAIKQWPNPNVIRAGNKYYSYSDPPDPSYGSSNGEGWQWKARKIAEAVSDDGISWKVTGYINPDPDCPATHVPEAYYENGKIYVGYACQKGGNPYDYRYGEIRKMWKQVADNEILAELFGGTLTTELGTHGTGNVYAPDVLYENGIYKMWYGGQGNDGHDRIHYAESADGITWDKKGVVLDNGNSNHVNDPSVVKVDGTYYMYYTDANVAENDRIHLATSTDGKTWVKKGIVLDVGPFQWNSRIVGRPSVMKQGSLWMMWYDTNDGVTSYVGYATSSDGMVWVKYQDPLLTGMGDVDVKKIGDLYYMIFGLRDGTHIATSQFGLSWTYRGLWFRKSGSIFDNFGHVSPFFYVDQNNNPNAIYFGGASIAPHHGNSMGIIRLNGDELNNLPPPSRFRGRIQGIKVKMPGNVQDAIPPSQETVYLDDALPTKTNPYFLDDVPAGAHKVSVTVPQGWSVGYTQCTNRVDCHQDVPTSGNSVNVNVPENGYVDLWWHYTQTVRCGNGNKEGTEECDDGNTNNGDGCTSDCKLERCTDGTFYNQCSSIKPKFCANGNLRNDCQNCGCLDNQECQRDGSCVANSCTTLDYNGDPKNKLDLLYIGDAYLNSDQVKFANDVNIFIRGLLDYEPFKSQRNKINFYRIDNTHDLACQYNCGGLKKLICCDWSKVEQAAAHCPHDYVFIIVNNDTYGGSGGYYSVSYRGNYNVSVHEFGHSFGGLSDEYVRGSCPSCDSKEKVNCDGTPDCPKWSNLPNTNCVKGCTYEEWYRPRENHSMMLDLNGSFNPVGERHLSKLMEAYS